MSNLTIDTLRDFLTSPNTLVLVTSALKESGIHVGAISALDDALAELAENIEPGTQLDYLYDEFRESVFDLFDENSLRDYLGAGTTADNITGADVDAYASAADCPDVLEALRRAIVSDATSCVASALSEGLSREYGVDIYSDGGVVEA